jgi:hypothetical protein
MSYTPPNPWAVPMRHSIDTLLDSWIPRYAEPAGQAAWPSANLAIYVPLRIPSRIVVRKLWVAVGNTATGNIDMALYDASGVAVVEATAAAHTSQMEQVFDVTDTTVGPGLYYIGVASDSGTDNFNRYTPAAPVAAAWGVLTQTSAYPLPSTATFALDQTLAYVPVAGLLIEATVA